MSTQVVLIAREPIGIVPTAGVAFAKKGAKAVVAPRGGSTVAIKDTR